MKRWILLLFVVTQTLTIQAKPVVCLHGFLTTERTMRPIECALSHVGFTVYQFEYESRRACIEDHACCLVSYLQQVACQCPGEPISFAAHSTGALVLRAALNLPGCPEEAKMGRAVLLAPPNQGSSLAHRFRNVPPIRFIMGNYSGAQLSCFDACDVHNLGTFPDTMQVLVIAGSKGSNLLFDEPNDGYITLHETALDTPYYWQCFYVTHGEILKDPQVLCCARSFLLYGYAEEEEKETPESSEEDPGENDN